jgi:UDP-N-acetylglucosamine 2-epimerase (non-hydrolysing)
MHKTVKNKVLVILGTRPEIIRLSSIIKKLFDNFETIVVNTNQNFDKNLNKVFFKELNLRKPKYILKPFKINNSIKFIANLLIKIDEIIDLEKPNAVLVLGDTNSSLSVFCAKRKKIPIFHIEAGNRCYDQRVPEEINRVLVDKISDINLVYSDVAKQNLIKENYDLDKIIKIGSPLFEVFEYYKDSIQNSIILDKLKLKKKNYILVSCHRQENLDQSDNLKNIFTAISILSMKYNLKVIFSTHPRIKNEIKKINKNIIKNIIFLKPFSFFEYIKLQLNAKLTISDSGSIVEEANILNFPAVNLRDTTERQEGMEKGHVILSSLKSNEIIRSSEIVMKNFNKDVGSSIHPDYLQINVSQKIVNIIQSYIHYINRKTWFK